MKLLICSDSHNNSITKLPLDDYDYIIHCGDLKNSDLDYFKLYPNLYYVKGNCDYNEYPIYLKLKLANLNIFITHSNLYNTKYSYDDLIQNTVNKYDLVLFGHTHKQICFKVENTIYINPGALKNNEYAYIIDNEIYLVNKDKIIKVKI